MIKDVAGIHVCPKCGTETPMTWPTLIALLKWQRDGEYVCPECGDTKLRAMLRVIADTDDDDAAAKALGLVRPRKRIAATPPKETP